MKISHIDLSKDSNSGAFIIAELSANHNRSLQAALDNIKAAKRAGADAINCKHILLIH